MSEPVHSFPLCWPLGWVRTSGVRARAKFGERQRGALMTDALDFVLGELRRMGVPDYQVVISTNRPVRRDGRPMATGRMIENDPGAAVYFRFEGSRRVLACDKWDRIEDNLWAIGKHIEALRGQERWGVGSLERAFAGYLALPGKRGPDCWETLGVASTATEEQVMAAYRSLAKSAHPDAGGTREGWQTLNDAKDIALATIRGRKG